jgi:hypothetical protein
MKRKAARRIYEELKDKSVEEQIEYWRKGTEEMKKRREVRAQTVPRGA